VRQSPGFNPAQFSNHYVAILYTFSVQFFHLANHKVLQATPAFSSLAGSPNLDIIHSTLNRHFFNHYYNDGNNPLAEPKTSRQYSN
jgi:hypothetical protein